MLTWIRKFKRDEGGATLVELAIVSPFLIALAIGSLEFGLALYNHHLISAGLRDGARYLARVDNPTLEQAKGKQLAAYGEINGTTRRVRWAGGGWDFSDISFSMVAVSNPVDTETGMPTYRGGDPIYVVRLSTDVMHSALGVFPAFGVTAPFRINIFHEERFIGD